MSDLYTEVNSNKDISKLKINNKLKNLNFITKYNVFSHLLFHVNAITDISKAYIPIKYNKASIINSDGKSEVFEFLPSNESNNYADLIIRNGYLNYSFKVVRVKSLSAIPMDGSHITWNISGINDNTFLVFYSINPNDMGKILLMSTKIYADVFVNYNYANSYYFDSNKTELYKDKLKISDKSLKLIDYSKDIDSEYTMNVNIKYNACIKTLNELNKNSSALIYKKTHFGKRYTAYNFKSGKLLHFRDCNARNNYFNWNTKIKLTDNHNINRNCKNQDLLVSGNNIDKFRMNIFENDGWIIMSYIPNIENIKDYIQTLFNKLITLSVKWKNRLKNIIKNINELLKKSHENLKKFKEKIKDSVNYFRPLHLLNYITCTNNVTIDNYYKQHSFMKKFFH